MKHTSRDDMLSWVVALLVVALQLAGIASVLTVRQPLVGIAFLMIFNAMGACLAVLDISRH